MRRVASILLFVCLLVGCLGLTTGASAVEIENRAHGVDCVVVLDMSTSMSTNDNGNDPDWYRLDATAMLISMLDMDGSRIAVVPFAGAPYTYKELGMDIALHDVSNVDIRNRLINAVYQMRTERPNTNIGSALMKANQILSERTDTGNRPMIVLMTDGQNMIGTSTKPATATIPESLRWEGGEIVSKGSEPYRTGTANQVTKEAVECAQTFGYPIYTVALTQSPDEQPEGGGLTLRQISTETGLENGCWSVNRANVNLLPSFFAEILADKIGSSVQMAAQPVKVDGTEDQYEVNIPVLNRSVRETNIIVPVRGQAMINKGIDAASIEVLFENVPQGTPTVMQETHRQAHFCMIKIRQPEPGEIGSWKLRFQSNENPTSIPFNILYNYNISLSAAVKVNGQETDTAYKSDRIKIEARFMNENGSYTDDAALYADHTNDDRYEEWMTIQSTWELYRLNASGQTLGEPVKSGRLNPDPAQRMFYLDVDLTQDGILPSGDYLVKVYARGAGLDRDVSIPLTLQNHVPVVMEGRTTHPEPVNRTSGDPQKLTWQASSEMFYPWNVREIVVDEDGDELQFTLTADESEEPVVTMKLNADGSLQYATQEENGKVKGGRAIYHLHYDDRDQGTGEVPLILTIISEVDADLDKYQPEMTMEGDAPSGAGENTFLKNRSVKILVRLKEGNSGYAGREVLERYLAESSIEIIDQNKDTSILSDPSFTLNDEGDAFEYIVPDTENKQTSWLVTANIGPFAPLESVATIPNDHDPKAEPSTPVEIRMNGQGVPSFLRAAIGTDTEENDPVRQVNPEELFSDLDGDLLAFDAPVFLAYSRDEELGKDMIWAEADAASTDSEKYHIQVSNEKMGLFNYSFQVRMRITAIDGDGRTGTYDQVITVIDLQSKMMTWLVVLLIVIAVLTILILVIHQIRKPKFPMLNLTIREEPSLYESGSETLSPVKTPINLNALGVDTDMAAKHSLSLELLQNIIVKPIRSKVSVGVSCKKMIGGHEVALDDVRMKPKKLYTWRIGQDLSVRNMNGEGFVVIKLEDRSMDTAADVMDNFGGSDEWAAEGDAASHTTGRKRSRKVTNRTKSVEPDDFTGGGDDFDF